MTHYLFENRCAYFSLCVFAWNISNGDQWFLDFLRHTIRRSFFSAITGNQAHKEWQIPQITKDWKIFILIARCINSFYCMNIHRIIRWIIYDQCLIQYLFHLTPRISLFLEIGLFFLVPHRKLSTIPEHFVFNFRFFFSF